MDKSKDAFRTISEVAEWLGTPTHVLRFWESRFTQVKPVKRAGGRRYYRPTDMELLGGIKKLLHDDGMTIRGVQKLLREEGVKHVSGMSMPINGSDGSIEGKVAAPAASVKKPAAKKDVAQSDAETVTGLRVVSPDETAADNVIALDAVGSEAEEPKAPVEDTIDETGDAEIAAEKGEEASDNLFAQEAASPPAPAEPPPIVVDVPADPSDDDAVMPAITDVASTLRNAVSSGHPIEPSGEVLGSLYDRLMKLRARMDGDTDG